MESTHVKIHSCENGYWHGYRLCEFNVYGVPCCMHICHDRRYPEVWTLPVMFGARLVLHPAACRVMGTSIDGFEAWAGETTATSHAYYVFVNAGGHSCIVGPRNPGNILAVSDECRRDNPSFPLAGAPVECLLSARLPIAEAYGYWPVRSFRASEEIAASYLQLYRQMGGNHEPV